MPPDPDAPYEAIDVDVTAKVEELRSVMTADPAVAADKILQCIDLLETMDKRQVAQAVRHRALKAEHRELTIRIDEIEARFANLLAAIQARQPGGT